MRDGPGGNGGGGFPSAISLCRFTTDDPIATRPSTNRPRTSCRFICFFSKFDLGGCIDTAPIRTCPNWACTVLDTVSTLSNLAVLPEMTDTGGMKRTVQVNVKMTQEDFSLLRRAADKHWPDAVMTNSGIVLAFAKIAAREVLGKKK